MKGKNVMSENEFNKIFADNLNFYLNLQGHTQADLAKYIGVSTASVSNWCKGIKLPRMDKVDKMCSFFQINRTDLMRERDATISQCPSTAPAASLTHTLTPDEADLIDDYRELNAYGKEEARNHMSYLTSQERYKKQQSAGEPLQGAG